MGSETVQVIFDNNLVWVLVKRSKNDFSCCWTNWAAVVHSLQAGVGNLRELPIKINANHANNKNIGNAAWYVN